MPLSITFDDGRSIQHEKYYPILDRFDLSGTFYIVTNWISKRGFMDLDNLIDLWKSHNEIGSHTHTHARLSSLTDEEVVFELETSKSYLSHFDCTTLAYPFGDYSERIALLAANYYSGARTYLPSKAGNKGPDYDSDTRNRRYALDALPMEHSINPGQPSLISLNLPQFKTNIENIVNKAVEQKAWTILVFHGPENPSLQYLAQKVLKHPMDAIRNVQIVSGSIKNSDLDDAINKFQWLCEFLAANEKIQVMTVAKAIKYFNDSSASSKN